MTDAVHILADVVGILFSLLALWLSTKPPTKRFTFGLHRLGTSMISVTSCFLFSLPFSTEVLRRKCMFSSVKARSDYRFFFLGFHYSIFIIYK